MVRIASGSSGRPSRESCIAPYPIGKTRASARERGSAGIVEGYVLGRHVVAQALVDRVAQRARLRPLAVVDGGDQARLDEARSARRLAAAERALVAGEWLEDALHAVELRPAEAGPHPPGVAQLPVLVVADEQRPEVVGAVALAREPAADHHVGAAHVLDLDPARRAAAGGVGAVEALGDHALESLRARGGEHRLAVADVMARRAPGRAVEVEREQALAALGVG